MVLPSRLGRIGWLLLMSAPLPAQECWLTIAYNDEPIPPYIKRDVPSAGPQGESFALVDLAAHRLGCQIHWQRLPTLRVLHDVTLGEVDAALFYSWTPERGQTLRYPQRDGKLDPARRLARLNYVLYRKQGAAVSWNGEQLQPRHCRVGYNAGWSISLYLEERQLNLHPGDGAMQLLRLVHKERLCAYATLDAAGDAAIAAWPGQFEKMQPPLLTKDYYLPFNPGYYQRHPERVEALWQQIGVLREAGATTVSH